MKTKQHRKFSLTDRLKSFSFAFNGIRILWKEEPNFRIHAVAAFMVLILGFLFRISVYEWLAVIVVIGLVFTAEIINTSIENLADFVSPGMDDRIKKIKDIAAAGVLFAATTAVIVGLIIFLPKIIRLFL